MGYVRKLRQREKNRKVIRKSAQKQEVTDHREVEDVHPEEGLVLDHQITNRN